MIDFSTRAGRLAIRARMVRGGIAPHQLDVALDRDTLLEMKVLAQLVWDTAETMDKDHSHG